MDYDYDKERREAVSAGERAKSSLQAALDALDSARSWGIFDLLGGGLIPSLVKRSKMGAASEYIEQARADLISFSRELDDIQEYTNVNVSTDDFWGLADLFFDGLFADLVMQNRINEARNQLQEAITKVETILARLQ